jgi:hypothetical protein
LTATFTLLVDNNVHDDEDIVTIDIATDGGSTVLASATISRTKFDGAFVPQQFNLSVTNPGGPQQLEFRVFFHCCSYIEHVVRRRRRAARASVATAPPCSCMFRVWLTAVDDCQRAAGPRQLQLVLDEQQPL